MQTELAELLNSGNCGLGTNHRIGIVSTASGTPQRDLFWSFAYRLALVALNNNKTKTEIGEDLTVNLEAFFLSCFSPQASIGLCRIFKKERQREVSSVSCRANCSESNDDDAKK